MRSATVSLQPLCGPLEEKMEVPFDVNSFGALIVLLTLYHRVPLDVQLHARGVDQLYAVHVERAGHLVGNKQQGCVHALLELAVMCLNGAPADRPVIEQVVQYVEDVLGCL